MEFGRWTDGIGPAAALNVTATLPFVIPSEAEGSAVRGPLLEMCFHSFHAGGSSSTGSRPAILRK